MTKLLLAARAGRNKFAPRLQNNHFIPSSRYQTMLDRSRVFSSDTHQVSAYTSLVGKTRNRIRRRPQDWHSHQPAAAFHNSSWQSSASSALASTLDENSLERQDDNDLDALLLEQEIDLFASSTLSALPDHLSHLQAKVDDLSIREGAAMFELELGIDPSEHADDDYFDDYEVESANDAGDSSKLDFRTNSPEELKTSAMEILRNFDPQDPPSTNNLEELQLWLEVAAQQEAVMRYQKLVKQARDRKGYESMGLIQRNIIQWFEDLRDAVEIRQKEYMLNQDTRRAKKRYGPLLCTLPADKMAVIAAHDALLQTLLHGGKTGRAGVPLVKIAHAIGSAVETEVISQRRMKQRFFASTDSKEKVSDGGGTEATEDETNEETKAEKSGTAIERWKFSASHLKIFLAELQRIDPSMGKSKRAVTYAMLRAKQAMDNDEGWTNEDRIHLGAALLSLLVEHAKVNIQGKEEPAFKVELRWSPKKTTVSYVVLNDSLYRMFTEDELTSIAASTTRHTPMIVPPTDWTGPRQGGYRWLQADLMRTHGSKIQREVLLHGDLSQVYEGLNILGKTAWKINKEILAIGQTCWNRNISIGDIPSRTDLEVLPEPTPPSRITPEQYADKESPEAKAAIEANQLYRESMYKWQRTIQKNMDLRSLRCSATLKLNQAEKFKDFEKIYFPYNLDFRGRAYPIPPHLSNVGSDLCRGMLMFSESKPLGKRGLYWLKVHLANFAGKDKMSFDDRTKYVDDNMHHVREAAKDPFSGENPWWMTLDDPFQGLATCHEIVRAIESGNPETYMCALPVHMDGSCNGLQHYAALGRDTVGGKAVNLLEGDGPEDVYVGVMHEVIRRVAEEAERELGFDTSKPDSLSKDQKTALKHNRAAKLVNGLIDRGVVKRTVMTSVYGVTYIGARQQIQEKIEEKLVEKGYDLDEIDREVFAAAGYLATVTMEVMGDLFQGARNTKTWLADCARLISQQGHPVAWISPIGIPAVQPYRQRRPRTVVTVMQSVTMTDAGDDLPVHKSRQCTAFPPNYVHSLDSSHMLLTAIEMDRRGLTFSAVHDSFWTHACDVDEMNEALRDCFIDLYSRPLLDKLKESWEIRYPEVEFPELPDRGNLDLDEVRSATYFFQ